MKATFSLPSSLHTGKNSAPKKIILIPKLEEKPVEKVVSADPQLLPSRVKVKKPRSRRKTIIIGVLIGIALFTGLFLATSGGLYLSTRHQVQQMGVAKGNSSMTPDEMKAVLQHAGKLTLLPTESPIMATIVNAKFLATQSEFYKDARDGDKLIVFPKAQKAFIYSPARDIIVNSGPMIADSPTPKPSN